MHSGKAAKKVAAKAEALEEDPVLIAKIVAAAQQCAPDYDEDKVYEVLMKE